MRRSLQPETTDDVAPLKLFGPETHRSPWRQKLVDAERGFTLGFRSDSTLFVQLFGHSLVLLTGLVIGLLEWQWIVLVLAITVVVVAELFNQAIRLLSRMTTEAEEQLTAIHALSTAASMVAALGGVTAAILIFVHRLRELGSL